MKSTTIKVHWQTIKDLKALKGYNGCTTMEDVIRWLLKHYIPPASGVGTE